MSYSVFSVVNQVALIFGRPLMDQAVVDLYQQATGIQKDDDFIRCLLKLLQVSKTFPLPADFDVFSVAHGQGSQAPPAINSEALEVVA